MHALESPQTHVLSRERARQDDFQTVCDRVTKRCAAVAVATAEQNAMEALASWKAASMRASNAKKATGPRLRA